MPLDDENDLRHVRAAEEYLELGMPGSERGTRAEKAKVEEMNRFQSDVLAKLARQEDTMRQNHRDALQGVTDQNLRADSTVEKLAKLEPVFGRGEGATMTAGNSTPLTDGASAVLLGTDEWAAEHKLPVLAHFVDAETAE